MFYHTGYAGTVHFVFLLHSLGADDAYTKQKMCRPGPPAYTFGWGAYTGSLYCPKLMAPGLEHLVFFIPKSNIYSGAYTAWGTPHTSTSSYSQGINALGTMACGNAAFFSMGGGACTSGMAGSMGADHLTEIMMMGLSNGGGASVYGHVLYDRVTKAVAIDYYGALDSQGPSSWIPYQSGNEQLNLKIYTACASAYYSTLAVTTGSTTFQAIAGLSLGSTSTVSHPPADPANDPNIPPNPISFTEYPYLGANGEMYYLVHGLDSSGSCNNNQITGTGNQVHTKMFNYPSYLEDVVAWTVAPSPPPAPPLAPGTVYTGTSRRLEEKEGRRALRGKEREAPRQREEPESPSVPEPKLKDASGNVKLTVDIKTPEDIEDVVNKYAADSTTYWNGLTL
jgi:hypothetical protein